MVALGSIERGCADVAVAIAVFATGCIGIWDFLVVLFGLTRAVLEVVLVHPALDSAIKVKPFSSREVEGRTVQLPVLQELQ